MEPDHTDRVREEAGAREKVEAEVRAGGAGIVPASDRAAAAFVPVAGQPSLTRSEFPVML
jgi:hypothetical protein